MFRKRDLAVPGGSGFLSRRAICPRINLTILHLQCFKPELSSDGGVAGFGVVPLALSAIIRFLI